MSDSVLTLPTSSNTSYAASSLLVQAYVAPHLPGLQVEQGSELSLKTSSANQAQGTGFLPIFKTLLQEAGQVDVAFAAQKEESEERKTVEKWIEASTSGQDVPLKELDEHLKNKTYIAANKLTAADVAVFGALNTYIAQASHDARLSHANVTRHFDLLQHTPFIATAASKVSPNLVSHEVVSIDLDNVPVVERKYESSKKDKKEKAAAAAGGEASKDGQAPFKKEKKQKGAAPDAAAATEAVEAAAAGDVAATPAQPAQGKKEKKAKKEGAAAEGVEGGKPKKEKAAGGGGGGNAAPEPITPGLIDMRVGKIIDVKKHPDADSLYVEQIDIGEAEPRTVVSGLVNYIPIEEMQGKMLIAVCNLKPASMRGIKSFAMVLAATSPDGKEGMGSVELVAPPEGSTPGDRVYFEGFESVKPLEQLPPKKKIFETIQPGFTTLETREAAWVDPSDKSKIAKIRTEKGVCKAPNFVGASLS
ncbi:nucleic acid-binding protein [Cystobasidium minutum MCA 4210]|uniref:nucleic acid-binding protein n=1 Tax=Cystobasidium minutum MCA 4210 TaxID=1397322 RepID=UPI0034D00D4F|eukprot:jgi/Rhomi1/91873/CE91872_3453